MSTPAEMANALQRNVACPTCGYNLRGLRGAVVQCPECGETCDVAKLITRGWTKPWYRAPHFNLLGSPAAVVYLGLIAMIVASGVSQAMSMSASMEQTLSAITGAASLLLWCYFMYRTWRVFASLRGPLFALLLHGVVVGYLFGCGVMLGGAAILIRGIMELFDLSMLIHAVFVIAGGVMCLVLGLAAICAMRLIERFVAGQCIARYLAVEAADG